jgi:hypothetical protein
MSAQKHIAVITVPFTSDGSREPEDIADEILHDILRCGIKANLDDIVDLNEPVYLRPSFVKAALEAGHGDAFKALFVFTPDPSCPDVYVCESVDLLIQKHDDLWVGIGAVGGEVEIMAVRNSDGSLNTEQMCRDWISVWHRHFVGAVEDSVQGLYLMIKQVVSEGKFIN